MNILRPPRLFTLLIINVFIILIYTRASAQTLTVSFTAANHFSLDSIHVSDLSQGWHTTLYSPDTTLFLSPSSSISTLGRQPILLSGLFPNPAAGNVSCSLSNPTPKYITADLYDINGRLLSHNGAVLPAGCHSLSLQMSRTGTYLLRVSDGHSVVTHKIVNTRSSSYDNISFSPNTDFKGSNPSTFIVGDLMQYTAFASLGDSVIRSKEILRNQTQSELLTFLFDLSGSSVPGSLPGLFSVSDSLLVFFSQGNLQYSVSASHLSADGTYQPGTFLFAASQYESIGPDNSNISPDYSGLIDLFGWATSGWNSGSRAFNPYDSINDYSLYIPGGIDTADLDSSFAFCDWGVYNSIANGGNQPFLWRTLSTSEWQYLLGDSPSRANRYAQASILDSDTAYYGIVILPDSFSLPSSCSFSPGHHDGFLTNSYTLDQWSAMQDAGAVFLPTTGYRNGSSVRHTSARGYYWSSSHDSSFPSYSAHCLYFVEGALQTDGGNSRSFGSAVRLVRNSQ